MWQDPAGQSSGWPLGQFPVPMAAKSRERGLSECGCPCTQSDAPARSRRTHRNRCQVRMREVREHPAEFSDRRSHRAHNVSSVCHVLSDVSTAPRALLFRHKRQVGGTIFMVLAPLALRFLWRDAFSSHAFATTCTMTVRLAGPLLPSYCVKHLYAFCIRPY
jgi:hypothetical protein